MNQLVSAVMPARGRKEWTRQAITSFLNQTYEPKELIILQDIDEPSVKLADYSDERLRIVTVARQNIPAKRNALTRLAKAEIVAHFDSDDWSHPDRLAMQVEMLLASKQSVVGFHSLLFVDEARRAYLYSGGRGVACGTSLVYFRNWALKYSFPEAVPVASDCRFYRAARDQNQLATCAGAHYIVARIHKGNTAAKPVANGGGVYRQVSASLIPAGFPK